MSMRKTILSKFKIRGYKLNIDALNEILAFAEQFPHDEQGETIDLLLHQLQKEPLISSIVDEKSIQRVINLLLRTEESTTTNSSLEVIDAFLVPKYRYDANKKRFIEHTSSLPIHGEASAKTEIYRERFMLLLQRVSRAKHFSRPVFDAGMSQLENYEISSIQSLIVPTGKRSVMGLISQLEDGHFYLEDLSASVEIDLSKAKIITKGFFRENVIVLAEGEMRNGIFLVITCGFPPLEERDKTLKTHSDYDFFGGGIMLSKEEIVIPESSSFVILSDIWLDDEDVLGKLETVLDGFESVEIVPSLFVFMGN